MSLAKKTKEFTDERCERNFTVVQNDPSVNSSRSILAFIRGFFKTNDLDLVTFKRLEGIAGPKEQNPFTRFREIGF